MENLNTTYEKLISERQKVIDELNILKQNEFVKKYLELVEKNKNLYNQQKDIITENKNQEYASCNHIWVITHVEKDGFGCVIERQNGCIKCGLNELALKKDQIYDGIDMASFEERIMINYLHGYPLRRGIVSKELCNIDLATAIYSKIKENNPDINDETALKYFEIALNDIRNIKVNEERKINRAKRLSLNPNFKNWKDNF